MLIMDKHWRNFPLHYMKTISSFEILQDFCRDLSLQKLWQTKQVQLPDRKVQFNLKSKVFLGGDRKSGLGENDYSCRKGLCTRQGPRHEFESEGARLAKLGGQGFFPFYCSFKTNCFAEHGHPPPPPQWHGHCYGLHFIHRNQIVFAKARCSCFLDSLRL